MTRFDGKHKVRDPVHGYISITDEERDILDTPQLQRLRKVRQMGMSSLVYPSATHTRFSHSLGVMHVAGEFADSLKLSDSMYRTLRIAGLVHDIGHGPFSHTSDRVAQRYDRTHEEYSCQILRDQMSSSLPDDIDISEVEDQIKGESDLNIIAGDIDADRIDYLNRDAINTGIEHGALDYQTIIKFSELEGDDIVFDRKAVFALTELLTARLYMHNAIMNHHVSRLAETILERALDLYVQENSVDEMMREDDYTMHYKLIKSENRRMRDLYNRVISRKLLKRAYTIRGNQVAKSVVESLSKIDEQTYEKKIAEEAGLDETEVIIVTPAVPRSEPSDILIKDNQNLSDLSTISTVPERLSEERAKQTRFHVYTKEGEEQRVSKIAESVLHGIIE